jgi:tetratricopeptide (TPR) repeat protein
MLETIREYALEQLAAKGEETAVRDAHAAHFLALAERAEPALYGWDQLVWLARLETEHDNLRAALGWAIAERDESAARLAAALGAFWEIRGYGSEGRRWLERALAIGGEPAARAKLLNGAGFRAMDQGDYATATAWHEEALALHRALGNERGVADALLGLGLVAMGQGDLDRAVSLLEEAAGLFRAIGDERRTADALFDLGIAAQQRGEQERAAALYEEVLAVYRAIGDQQGIAYALMGLSTVAREQGDRRRAMAHVAEALAICRTIGDRGASSARSTIWPSSPPRMGSRSARHGCTGQQTPSEGPSAQRPATASRRTTRPSRQRGRPAGC